MKKDLRHRMGQAHEAFLAEIFDGRIARSSGNQFSDQMDGRQDRYDVPIAFAWDGKSTLAASASITRPMWEKAEEQSHGERPMVALRFYDNERLGVGLDLVTVTALDMSELMDAVVTVARIKKLLAHMADIPMDYEEDMPGTNLLAAFEQVLRGEIVTVEAWVETGVLGKVEI